MKKVLLDPALLICPDTFFLIAGPCVVESEEITREIAMKLKEISEKYNLLLIFKASYRKANRTKNSSFSGIGDKQALEIIGKIRDDFKLPTLTDIHNPEEAEIAAPFVDVLQIPAFLCRQTDLLKAAGQTGKFVNIKKGQFLSGQSMSFALEKVRATGNKNIMLTERGTQFGYSDLIVDFRNIPIMKKFGVPVVLDVTHSLQQPNRLSGVTGGQPEMIETIARAGIAAGTNGIFIETHPNPSAALSDGENMLALSKVDELIKNLMQLTKRNKY
ncbi:MAG: 3-deoxy-8-phosphooctulonate synthase [Bacteroidales bacterium]|nr:3-deoxy-8-phosphooctulonate synthase [Bacteroidales bacterium]